MIEGIFSYILPAQSEQRPDKQQLAIFPLIGEPVRSAHPAYTLESCPPKQVQQQCLEVVIGVVGRCDSVATELFAELGEPAVALFAGRHLYPAAMLAGVSQGIEMY